MKNIIKISIVLSAIFLFVTAPVNAQDNPMKGKSHSMEKMAKKANVNFNAIDKNKDGKIYGCQMCGQYSDEPGKCPSCGGDLHEMTAEDLKNHAKMHKGNMKMGDMHMHKGMHGDMDKGHKHMKNADNAKKAAGCMYDKNKDGKVYQCPMCPDQISDKPGDCPKCGMALKEVPNSEAKAKLMKMKKGMMDKNGK
jgi:rubrerythrin